MLHGSAPHQPDGQLVDIDTGFGSAYIGCYGDGGPWASRAGYEPLGQAVPGLAIAEGTAAAPKLVSTSMWVQELGLLPRERWPDRPAWEA